MKVKNSPHFESHAWREKMSGSDGFDWVGLGLIGLDWIDWIGLGWVGLGWIEAKHCTFSDELSLNRCDNMSLYIVFY